MYKECGWYRRNYAILFFFIIYMYLWILWAYIAPFIVISWPLNLPGRRKVRFVYAYAHARICHEAHAGAYIQINKYTMQKNKMARAKYYVRNCNNKNKKKNIFFLINTSLFIVLIEFGERVH